MTTPKAKQQPALLKAACAAYGIKPADLLGWRIKQNSDGTDYVSLVLPNGQKMIYNPHREAPGQKAAREPDEPKDKS